jgi:microcystin-dependent protein
MPELPRRRFLGRAAILLAGLVAAGRPRLARASTQSLEPFLGEIMLVSFTFAPKGWALCNGQLLPINQNQALFSILGTTYGGDGRVNFALPDLRGRTPLHWGTGQGLSSRVLGERAGEANHTLVLSELPAHTHVARCASTTGTSANPSGMVPARCAASIPGFALSTDTSLAAGAIASVGGSQAHTNTQPVLALNYVIALQGVFPSPS